MRYADCHPDRRHYSFGLCSPCYDERRRPRKPTAAGVERQRLYDAEREWVPRTEQQKLRARELHLRNKYGLTLEQYDLLLAAQDGRCAICRREPKVGGLLLNVDHCHREPKIVRGLLCGDCNRRVVGNHTLERLQQAVQYLSSPPAVAIIGEIEVPKRKRKSRAKTATS